GAGQYAPTSDPGRRLLAHELAHVVQQGRGGSHSPSPFPGSSLERAADRAAAAVSPGMGFVNVAGASARGLARQAVPRSLSVSVNPEGMTTDEISAEMSLIEQWVTDNQSSPDADRLQGSLQALRAEFLRRQSGQGGKPAGAPSA